MQTYSITCFCVLLLYTTHCWESQVNLFSTLLISPELFMWNDTQSQMVPSGHRTATGSVFTYVCNFTSFFFTAIIDVFLFNSFAALSSQQTFFWHSNPQKNSQWLFWVHFPRKDWSSRPLLISDITVTYRWPLTFDLIACSLWTITSFCNKHLTSFVFVVSEGHTHIYNYNWWCQMLYKNK